MTVKEHLSRIESANKAFNAHDWDGFFELYAESVVFNGPDSPEPLKGRAALQAAAEGYAAAVPDLHVKTERIFGQGDWVCQEYTLTGTQTGPVTGPDGETIPPTNQTLRVRGCGTYRFEGGQIAEEFDYRWPSSA